MAQQTGRMARRVLVSTLSLLFGTAAHAGFYPGTSIRAATAPTSRALPPTSYSISPTPAYTSTVRVGTRPIRIPACRGPGRGRVGSQRNGLPIHHVYFSPDGHASRFVCAGSIGSMADPRRLLGRRSARRCRHRSDGGVYDVRVLQQRPILAAVRVRILPGRMHGAGRFDDPAYLSVNRSTTLARPGRLYSARVGTADGCLIPSSGAWNLGPAFRRARWRLAGKAPQAQRRRVSLKRRDSRRITKAAGSAPPAVVSCYPK